MKLEKNVCLFLLCPSVFTFITASDFWNCPATFLRQLRRPGQMKEEVFPGTLLLCALACLLWAAVHSSRLSRSLVSNSDLCFVLLWETTWQSLKKLNLELSRDLAVPLLVTHLRARTSVRTKTSTLIFTATLFIIIAYGWKQSKCPSTSERITKGGIALQWDVAWQEKGMKYRYRPQHGRP